MTCKKCGSTRGWYTNIRGRQYYDEHGEPDGFVVDNETKTTYCINCGYQQPYSKIKKIGVNNEYFK